MDPFTSLSLAVAIIQVVDFGSKLVGKGHEIFKNGSIANLDDAKVVASGLKEVTETMSQELTSISTSTTLTVDQVVSDTRKSYRQLLNFSEIKRACNRDKQNS